MNEIINRTGVAATDTVIDGDYIAIYWIISTRNNKTEVIGGIASTR